MKIRIGRLSWPPRQFRPDLDDPQQRWKLGQWAWIALVVVSIADLVSTAASLRVGLPENNPLMRAVIENWGLSGFGFVKAVVIAVAYVSTRYVMGWNPKVWVYGPVFWTVLTGLVAVANTVAVVLVLVAG